MIKIKLIMSQKLPTYIKDKILLFNIHPTAEIIRKVMEVYCYDGYDEEGFNFFGFNRDGYDRDGYDRDDFNVNSECRFCINSDVECFCRHPFL